MLFEPPPRCRTALQLLSSSGYRKLLSIVYLCGALHQLADQLWFVPYLSYGTNAAQGALVAMLFYGSACLAVHLHGQPAGTPSATAALFYGLLPAAAAGVAATGYSMRRHRSVFRRFLSLAGDPEQQSAASAALSVSVAAEVEFRDVFEVGPRRASGGRKPLHTWLQVFSV